MTEFIERVARAICCASGCMQEKVGNTCDWRMMEAEARSAIVAMREPSDAMAEAGFEFTRRPVLA